MEPIVKAIDLIKKLHDGQFDWTGDPYWQHPVAVMNLLPANSPIERKLIALFHDVLEDCTDRIGHILGLPCDQMTTHAASQYLSDQGYSDHVVRGVSLLTRDKDGMTYLDEIKAIVASGHVDAMWVKLCDNTHNTDPSRIERLSEQDRIKAHGMGKRYAKSKMILSEGIIASIPPEITYTNWKGETAIRRIRPLSLRFGSTDWHPKPQWLLAADDLKKGVSRDFAIEGII